MKAPDNTTSSRRKFLYQTAALLGGSLIVSDLTGKAFAQNKRPYKVKVNGHLWVYASKYPPKWDSTPDLETIFEDFSYAGMDGLELMNVNLSHDDAVTNLNRLIKKYNVPVSGTSYGGSMWDQERHKEILDDVKLIVRRLSQVQGKTFGISVGDAKRVKTEKELDAQASLLKQVLIICKDHGIQANLHNHTYEVENGMHDLKGTLLRVPEVKLGPDLNWLIRGGVNPVDFINSYGSQIVYMHIRDQYADGKWTEYLGQGDTNFRAIANALKAQKFKGSVAVELAFPADFKPANPLKEDWKKSREFVNKIFGW